MNPSQAHKRFSSKIVSLGGVSYMGQITRFSEQVTVLDYPSRLLKVSPLSTLGPGETVRTPDGQTYVTAVHMSSFSADQIFKLLRLIPVDEELSWKRPGETVDPITGLSRGTGLVDQNPSTIFAMVDPMSLDRSTARHPESKVRLVCGHDLVVGDRVGSYTVRFVDRVLGVTVAEAQ